MDARLSGAVGAIAALCFVASEPASAALIRVDFAGSVTVISGQIYQLVGEPTPISPAEAEAALGGSIHVGTLFSGFLVYDDSAMPVSSFPESAGAGFPTAAGARYSFPPGPGAGPYFAAHGEIGSFTADGNVDQGNSAGAELSDNELYIDGSHPSSVFFSAGVSNPSTPAGVIALTLVGLYAAGVSPGSPLHGTSLQSIPWDLESFPTPVANFVFQNGDLQVTVGGTVTQLVPEPASVSLVALAAYAMLAARRRFFGV